VGALAVFVAASDDALGRRTSVPMLSVSRGADDESALELMLPAMSLQAPIHAQLSSTFQPLGEEEELELMPLWLDHAPHNRRLWNSP